MINESEILQFMCRQEKVGSSGKLEGEGAVICLQDIHNLHATVSPAGLEVPPTRAQVG